MSDEELEDEREDEDDVDPEARWPGYHDCPCCDMVIFGGLLSEERCDCCVEAGCEKHDCARDCGYEGRHDVDGVYDDCQVPRCPTCDTEHSFMNDHAWHTNCDDEALCESVYEVEYHGLPSGVVALDLGHAGYWALKLLQEGTRHV